jgi:hypothetical protein
MRKNKIITWLLCIFAVCFLAFTPQMTAYAQSNVSLDFALTADGKNVVYAQKDDIINVTFAINRTDSEENLTITFFQNLIRFDEEFFELVEGSIEGKEGADASLKDTVAYGESIHCITMAVTPVSSSAVAFCTFKLKVIGAEGSGYVFSNFEEEDQGYNSTAIVSVGECSVNRKDLQVIYGTEVVCQHTEKTKIDAKPSSCTERGWDEYYICNADDCGAILDKDGHQLANIPFIPESHSFGSELVFDELGHWYQCANCGEKKDYSAHIGGTATCKDKAVCTACAQEYGSLDEKNHSGEITVKNKKITWFWGRGYSGDVYCSDCGLVELGEEIPIYTFSAWPWWIWVLCIILLPWVLASWLLFWLFLLLV